jgi:hypothetical protein
LRGVSGPVAILLHAFGRLREEWDATPILGSLREALAAWKHS